MKHWIILPLLTATGCASIMEGSSQRINVNSTPEGARCEVSRNGAPLATIASTPDAITVTKTKYDLAIDCIKAGYKPASVGVNSGLAAITFGNALIGGPIGLGVDFSTGAYNKYDDNITVTLEANATSAGAAPEQNIFKPLTDPAVSPVAEVNPAQETPKIKTVQELSNERADRYNLRRNQH